MGLSEEKFVSEVEESLKCALCRGVLDAPLCAPCGRVYCSACILPSVVKQGKCPLPDCNCQDVSPTQLKQSNELRHTILNLQVRCDFLQNGCQEIVTLSDLPSHNQECLFRTVLCRNQGCTETMSAKELIQHESDNCDYRPVGICQSGCGLVILHHENGNHDCLVGLRTRIASQELTIASLELDMKKLTAKFSKREKQLVTQITGLHGEIQLQALRFQKKVGQYQVQTQVLSKKAAQNKLCEELKTTIVINRDGGTMGFNIMGGYSPDSTSPGEGILVSRIHEGGPADRNGMHLYDQIIQVSQSRVGSPGSAPIEQMVNGQDLSKSTHEEAVEAFRTAKEPIVVEVLRRVTKAPSTLNTPSNNNNNKMKTTPSPPTPPSPIMVTVATQTDEALDSPTFFNMFRVPTPPPALFAINGNGSLVQPSSRQPVAFSPSADIGLTDLENGLEFDDNYDDDRAFADMEYEEVILNRASKEEKVGLTLCYGAPDDDITDIFISEIEPYSTAAQDGRIHEGDQILQINGVDVQSREQAISLFNNDEPDITLLLARPQFIQADDGFMEDQHFMVDELQMDMLESHHHRNMEFTANMLAQGNEEEGGTTDTATTENSSNKHEKDSGVGRTDDSTRNDESSEQEMMENDCQSPGSNPPFATSSRLSSGDLHFSNDSFTSNEAQDQEMRGTNEISAEECDKFREVLETRCSSVEGSPHHKARGIARKDSQSSIEREIAQLNREMEEIQIECQEIVEAHARERTRIVTQDAPRAEPYRSPRMVPRMGTKLDYVKSMAGAPEAALPESIWMRSDQMGPLSKDGKPRDKRLVSLEERDRDTSTTSAYNTGDSCRSTPLTLELNQHGEEACKGHKNSMLSLAHPKPSHSDSEKMTQTQLLQQQQLPGSKEWSSDGDAKKRYALSKSHSSGSVSRMSQTPQGGLHEEHGESLQELYAQYADVMYTNRANLEHTIQVQQKLFQQQLKQSSPRRPTQNGHVKGMRKAHPGFSDQEMAVPSLPTPGSGSNHQMEWVVKRRADGTRYITRRPVRNRMLKERAKKISEERSGLTTDDDAQSELKVGRYWSKEDRKRHIEKARDHKKRKELMIKQKMDTLKETEEGKKEPNIVELSHRKMMRHKGKKVLDNFTTVQEMLAHGSRESQSKTYNPLLSVTTV